MLKVGLIGLGAMGRAHLECYERLQKEGFPLRLVAICDADTEKLKPSIIESNVNSGIDEVNLNEYQLFTNLDAMLELDLDYVDITLPTYLHSQIAIKAFEKGLHVLCEKPMALSDLDCKRMIEAGVKAGKQLMVGQCLRFWPTYEYLKEILEQKTFGEPLGAYFFRGCGTPQWSPWLTQKEKSGGGIYDLHVHDTDAIHWIYGKPDAVNSLAKNVIPGAGYDIVSTNFIYESGLVINAQADWTLNGDFGFEMSFRANFEKGNLLFQGGVLKVNPQNEPAYTPEISNESAYYREIKYFAEAILNGTAIETATPESTRITINIIEAEVLSAEQKGKTIVIR